jgi:hypothetical protein
VRVRRQRDVADQVAEPDEEEERAQEWEPLPRHRVGHVAASDVVAHQRVERFDGGLDAVRAGLHAAGDPDHRADRERAGDDHVEHRLVDVERPGEVDPDVELELVLRLELLVVAPGEAEDRDQQSEDAEVEREAAEEDLPSRGHFRSRGRSINEVAK